MFHRGNSSRRGFLRQSTAAMAAAGIPAWFANEVLAEDDRAEAQKKKPSSANDRVLLGAIGIGSPQSRGLQLFNDVNGAAPNVAKYVAVCDVDARHAKRAAEIVKKNDRIGGEPPAIYKDFRELNDRKDINAVIISTPDHWHALVAIDALRKGKDVYCEKPLTLTIREAQAIAKVAKETGRVFQTGNQQRSDYRGMFRLAAELTRNGRVGKVKRIECRIGSNPQSPAIPKAPVPEGLDWDFWCGPTPLVDYVEMKRGNHTFTRCHYEFRWWYDYSGGKMTDWGAHHLDIAQWALGMDGSGPLTISAQGTPPSKDANSYSCHEDFVVTYQYPNDVTVLAMSKGENGVKIEGDEGWIFVGRGRIDASDKKLLSAPLSGNKVKLEVSPGHMRNFFDCLQSRKKPICNADIGASSVTICHLGVIALQTGKTLNWDAKKQQFDDADANALRSREMRAPWKLDV